MNSSSNKLVPQNRTPGRKRPATNNSKILKRCRRKSLRMRQSISLHIPIDELSDSTNYGMNCYIQLPHNVFSLTYLEVDETQNPDSLRSLEVLKGKRWQAYLASPLHNFSYHPAQMRAVEKSLNIALRTEFQNSNHGMTYDCEMSIAEELNPTENDNQALVITVIGRTEEKDIQLYEGYLLSWCNPVKDSSTLLPILLCFGKAKYQTLVHRVLSEKFDIIISRVILTQEEFMHISTYCLIMLEENDSNTATFCYKIFPGKINLSVKVEHLLKLWKKIHKDDNNEVELDQVVLFYEALETFFETTFGIKLGLAHFENIFVKRCFYLQTKTQVWFKSTRIAHVVLKYLNFLAVQRQRVKALIHLEESNTPVKSVVCM